MASLDMINTELESFKKLGTESDVEYRVLKNFKYKCKDGQVCSIAYPTNTPPFVIPLHTVGVMSFVLYYLEMPYFLQHWVVYFPTEISDEHFICYPFRSAKRILKRNITNSIGGRI